LPLRLEERAPIRAFWRSHFEVWELSGLTQREYCERHGLSLKNFGNWRARTRQAPKARWGRYPRLRPGVTGSERRRQFSEAAKRRIVGEASRPGGSLSEVARRCDIDLRLLFSRQCEPPEVQKRSAWNFSGAYCVTSATAASASSVWSAPAISP